MTFITCEVIISTDCYYYFVDTHLISFEERVIKLLQGPHSADDLRMLSSLLHPVLINPDYISEISTLYKAAQEKIGFNEPIHTHVLESFRIQIEKSKKIKPVCIGMFGTCNGSQWREDYFYKTYLENGLIEGENFFNPQVAEWDESCAKVEAIHLANDDIILFPVTGESYGFGSLGESGFSIVNSIKINKKRDVIVMIESELDEQLKEDKLHAKDSVRTRRLVIEHLKKQDLPNVFVIDCEKIGRKAGFEEMLKLSLVLYENRIRLRAFENKK